MNKIYAYNWLWLVLLLGSLLGAIGSEYPRLELEGNAIDTPRDYSGEIIRIQTARLFYKANDGYPAATNESYLLVLTTGGYPQILDVLPGHTAKLEIRDINSDNKLELLVFYASGGNQYALNVYLIDNSKLVLLINGQLASNMHSITIEGESVIVINQSFISSEQAKIEKAEYRIEGNAIVQQSLTSEILSR